MNLITHLLILLASARFLGRCFQSIGLSPIVGEILAGLILGPTLLGFVTLSPELSGIIELSIFLMIFAAGFEMNLQDLFSAFRKKALLCALVGFVVSFTAGLLLGNFWQLPILTSFVLSLCFSITSLPVVFRFMYNNKIQDTPMGHTIMATAVILEVATLLLLGVLLNIETFKSPLQFAQLISLKVLGMVVFFAIVMIMNKFLRSELFSKPNNRLSRLIQRLGDDAIFGAGVVFVLLFSTATEALGFHFIIGAFFGGLLLNKDVLGGDAFISMSNTLNSITTHFLTPIFFASIGLHFSVLAFSNPWLLGSVILVAYSSKILGSSIGARWAGFKQADPLKIGIALNSRGTLDLIIAEIALSKNYLDSRMFSILICTSLLALLMNPLMYKQVLRVFTPKNAAGT